MPIFLLTPVLADPILFLVQQRSIQIMGSNKPRGLQAARKLRTTRRENRWADKNYKKRALGKFYKTSPTGGSSHAKGIVLEKVSWVCVLWSLYLWCGPI